MSRADHLDRLLDLAFDEDLGAAGDVTTDALVPEDAQGAGVLMAKEPMVLSGLRAFTRAFQRFDPSVTVRLLRQDGEKVEAKARVAEVQGPMRSLLVAERTALNLVQRTCGIATLARQAADAVKGTRLKVLDTRKTAPGFRSLAKEAVRHGGAYNHRFGLSDGVLIKDNHIAAVGGIRQALQRAKERAPRLAKIEIEVTSLEQLKEVLAEGADVILLDNMNDITIREAVRLTRGQVKLEVSGGITLERLRTLSRIGVDYVSMGALTHSARAMDLSLELEPAKAQRRATRR